MKHDEAINHNAASTVATAGGKAVKYGLLGGLAAAVIPAVVVGGGGLLVAAFVGSLATGSVMGGVAALASLVIGAAAIVGGIAAGASSAGMIGTGAVVGGGLLGAMRGGNQVSRENQAFRNRSQAAAPNPQEIKGVQQGYQMAQAEMMPMMQQREQMAFQKGQEAVVSQLQEQMNAQMTAAASQEKKGNFADKELSLKCESKAQAILKDREIKAIAPKEHGAH